MSTFTYNRYSESIVGVPVRFWALTANAYTHRDTLQHPFETQRLQPKKTILAPLISRKKLLICNREHQYQSPMCEPSFNPTSFTSMETVNLTYYQIMDGDWYDDWLVLPPSARSLGFKLFFFLMKPIA